MNISIELPRMTATGRDPTEQLNELYRFLFELTTQISFVFDTVTTEIASIKEQIAKLEEGNDGNV